VEVTPLTLQLLQLLDEHPRTYRETINAWASQCPRLTIWEDPVEAGFIRAENSHVTLTPSGEAALAAATAQTRSADLSSARGS
jgi:hypothetical protein